MHVNYPSHSLLANYRGINKFLYNDERNIVFVFCVCVLLQIQVFGKSKMKRQQSREKIHSAAWEIEIKGLHMEEICGFILLCLKIKT